MGLFSFPILQVKFLFLLGNQFEFHFIDLIPTAVGSGRLYRYGSIKNETSAWDEREREREKNREKRETKFTLGVKGAQGTKPTHGRPHLT